MLIVKQTTVCTQNPYKPGTHNALRFYWCVAKILQTPVLFTFIRPCDNYYYMHPSIHHSEP